MDKAGDRKTDDVVIASPDSPYIDPEASLDPIGAGLIVGLGLGNILLHLLLRHGIDIDIRALVECFGPDALFRVRNKKETCYCYSPEEKESAIARLKTGVEITRFKGLGEISSHEFVDFIGENMRLDPVKLADEESISEIMEFYMGDNTGERQLFIMENLRSEEELEDVNI